MEITHPPPKPVLVFDGQCGFCRRRVRRWQRTVGERIDYQPFQDTSERFSEIPRERFERAVHFIEPDGHVSSGAEAVFRSQAVAGYRRWPLIFYNRVAGVRWITERGYRFVAEHRGGLERITQFLYGSDPGPSSNLLTRWLFIRLVALVYLIAFVSLGVQAIGLIGADGILPADEYLNRVRELHGSEAYWRLPTLAWFDCSDRALKWSCWAGAAVSVLAFFRVAPAICLVVAWVLYLSLYHVGQSFLSFQWDLLLLEAGFLAVLVSSWKLWPRLGGEKPPPRLAIWLVWWLLFRLMFTSGVVKLLDDHPVNRAWHELTALNYHYETQCIPNVAAWYAHQLPEWFQKISVAGMFAIELGVPFMIFLPRRLRILAFFPLVFFMLLIIATGNYNFFNLLTIALCVCLLDDAFLRGFFPRSWSERALRWPLPRPGWIQRVVTACLGVAIVWVSAMWMGYSLRSDRAQGFAAYVQSLKPDGRGVVARAGQFIVDAGAKLFQISRPLACVNTYGLFRNMTIERPEIVIEGSDDGVTWLAYEFRWKPGDPMRGPAQVAPHQPRLDWQMWFAALGSYRSSPWFVSLMKRLLEGREEVMALLGSNPFGDKPPKYLRATRYDYHFTTRAERRETGAWWKREPRGRYFPEVALESFRP